jgi:amino acid transporter
MFTDAFSRVGLFDFNDERVRRKSIAVLAWVIPIIWGTLFLFMGRPGLMVFLGGLATVVILLIVVYAAIFFRYRRLDKRLLPTRLYDICLWVSSISIVVVAAYVGWDTIYKLMS